MSPGKHVSPQHLAESSKTLVFARSSGILKWNLSCAHKHRTCKQLGFVRLWAWQDVIIWYYMSLAPLVDWSVRKVARCCRRVETCLVCLPQLRMPRQTPWQLLTAPGGFMESSATSVKSQTLGGKNDENRRNYDETMMKNVSLQDLPTTQTRKHNRNPWHLEPSDFSINSSAGAHCILCVCSFCMIQNHPKPHLGLWPFQHCWHETISATDRNQTPLNKVKAWLSY